jgi:hypothetical protein
MAVPPAVPAEADAAGDPPEGRGTGRRPTGAFAGLSPFSSPAFCYLFVGTALTMAGNHMQQVAQGWLIYDLTNSPTWLGITSFARDILHTGPGGLGMLMTAMGIGSIVGSVGVVLLPMRHQGLSLFVSLAAFGLLLAAFAASTWLPLSVGLMGLLGVAQAIYMATNNTLVQLATPDELRGRVMSVYVTTWGLMPLGALPQGVLADWFGAPIVTAGVGLLSCLVVILMAVRSPALRRI